MDTTFNASLVACAELVHATRILCFATCNEENTFGSSSQATDERQGSRPFLKAQYMLPRAVGHSRGASL
jgi:hypothetical protein